VRGGDGVRSHGDGLCVDDWRRWRGG
jgi:hypothetical protein